MAHSLEVLQCLLQAPEGAVQGLVYWGPLAVHSAWFQGLWASRRVVGVACTLHTATPRYRINTLPAAMAIKFTNAYKIHHKLCVKMPSSNRTFPPYQLLCYSYMLQVSGITATHKRLPSASHKGDFSTHAVNRSVQHSEPQP
jgi:hypothetical protein